MKKISIKLKKLITIVAVILTAIYLYNNKPYSLFEINRIKSSNDLQIQSAEEYYKIQIDKHTKQNIDRFSKTFQVKKNENISVILKKINLKTPNIMRLNLHEAVRDSAEIQ